MIGTLVSLIIASQTLPILAALVPLIAFHFAIPLVFTKHQMGHTDLLQLLVERTTGTLEGIMPRPMDTLAVMLVNMQLMATLELVTMVLGVVGSLELEAVVAIVSTVTSQG